MVLAFDPSSSAIGFAGMTSATKLCHVGVITPDDKAAAVADRLPQMLDEARAIVLELMPAAIVIEMPQRHAKKTGGHTGASLAMYGWACGAIWQMCRMLAFWPDARLKDMQVITIGSGTWSRCSKEMRALGVRTQFKQLNKLKDPGMDASDAVALAQWWFARNSILTEVLP